MISHEVCSRLGGVLSDSSDAARSRRGFKPLSASGSRGDNRTLGDCDSSVKFSGLKVLRVILCTINWFVMWIASEGNASVTKYRCY
ncbi:hypothetical protein ANTQUA_LOCUS4303 [Anthophora quadrimaculata]